MQLDLLNWTPPVQIILFPITRRVGHIRRTAQRIHESRTQREADAFWRRAVDGLTRQMEKAGLPDYRIGDEIERFRGVVQAEVYRLGHQTYRPDGGAA